VKKVRSRHSFVIDDRIRVTNKLHDSQTKGFVKNSVTLTRSSAVARIADRTGFSDL